LILQNTHLYDRELTRILIPQALQYLEESPCKTQTRENIMNYVKDLSSYRLKSHEVLQMINDPPTSALHTQLVRISLGYIYIIYI